MKLHISFPGGEKVQAEFDGFKVMTDQEGLAPAPFDLFLASLGTCAGYFVKSFCDERKISTEGLTLEQEVFWDEAHRLKEIQMKITLPKGFPERYRAAVVTAAQLCSVKKALQNPPEFKIEAL
jgi:ribosomal protein S12 methylthiotransferase accessory factor